MDNLNRIVSFVLGLVVVLVFFAVVTGRLSLGSKLKFPSANIFGRKATPTPVVKTTPAVTGSIAVLPKNNDDYRQYDESLKNSNSTTIRTIPSTGVPAIYFPAMLATAVGGYLLRKAGKK